MLKRLQRYEDTAANLAADNRVYPANWEIVESDTGREKHSDGLTHYNDLVYMGGGLIRLATKTVDLLTLTKQVFFTVPTGLICIPVSVIVRNPSTDLGGILGSIFFGFDSGAADMGLIFTRTDLNFLGQTRQCIGKSIIAMPAFDASSFIRGGAGDTFGCLIPDGDTAATVDIDVFGYFVNV